MKIAVLSNETALLRIFNSTGHDLVIFTSARELQHHQADMLIVDNAIADNATKIMANMKEKCAAILFIAANFADEEIVEALAAGASDYLIKPIRPNELRMRVEVLLRRAYPDQFAPEILEFGRYVFETRRAHVTLSGQFIDLTQKEFDLALLLFRNLGKPLSRATMLNAVWSRESDLPSRTLDTHVSRVRNKLQLRPKNGFQLVPLYSYGYQLEQINLS